MDAHVGASERADPSGGLHGTARLAISKNVRPSYGESLP
jgi:hypothetical protein